MAQRSLHIKGLNSLIAHFDRASGGLVDKELMGEIGTYLANAILGRTAVGEDAKGNPFEPYSPKYALFRQKTGYPTNVVDLFYSGSMLSSLTHEAFEKRVELFFMNTHGVGRDGKQRKASNAEIAFHLNEKREFFAVSSEEEEQIFQMVQNHIQEILAGD